MRDTVSPLPDVAEKLAADGLPAGFLPRHDPLRGRKDGDAEAAVDARDLVSLHVDTQSGLAHALKPVEDGLFAAVVAQLDLQRFLRLSLFRDHGVVLDEA